jgi:hypothetical protein
MTEEPKLIVRPDGKQEWFVKNRLHREGAPAIIYPDGSEEWFVNGLRHREDGPAIIYQMAARKGG